MSLLIDLLRTTSQVIISPMFRRVHFPVSLKTPISETTVTATRVFQCTLSSMARANNRWVKLLTKPPHHSHQSQIYTKVISTVIRMYRVTLNMKNRWSQVFLRQFMVVSRKTWCRVGLRLLNLVFLLCRPPRLHRSTMTEQAQW